MRILYLGDVHGNYGVLNQYINIYGINNAHIIQCGDFGVGFKTLDKDRRELEMYHTCLVKNNVILWIVRGNHDKPEYFKNDPFGFTNIKLVDDYTVLNLEDKNILCVGGAVSVDRSIRYTKRQLLGDYTPIGNECWWPDERFVLDEKRLNDLRGINVVVTHTAPSYCPRDNTFGYGGIVESYIKSGKDLTLSDDLRFERCDMNKMFEIINQNNIIENHYYGHFHYNNVLVNGKTTHRLLGIGELWEERVDI